MLGIVTDYHDLALALDNLALLAHLLNRRSDFHRVYLLFLLRPQFAKPIGLLPDASA